MPTELVSACRKYNAAVWVGADPEEPTEVFQQKDQNGARIGHIASVAGERYAITVAAPLPSNYRWPDYYVKLYIDGRLMQRGSTRQEANGHHQSCVFQGTLSGSGDSGRVRQFKFSRAVFAEGGALPKPELIKELGTIRLSIYRGRKVADGQGDSDLSGERVYEDDEKATNETIPERAVKAAIGDLTSREAEIPSSVTYFGFKFHPEGQNCTNPPFKSFIFTYKPLPLLQAMGIAPADPVPEVKPEDVKPSNQAKRAEVKPRVAISKNDSGNDSENDSDSENDDESDAESEEADDKPQFHYSDEEDSNEEDSEAEDDEAKEDEKPVVENENENESESESEAKVEAGPSQVSKDPKTHKGKRVEAPKSTRRSLRNLSPRSARLRKREILAEINNTNKPNAKRSRTSASTSNSAAKPADSGFQRKHKKAGGKENVEIVDLTGEDD